MAGEGTFVNPIVDSVINPLIELIDLGRQLGRIQWDDVVALIGGQQVVKLGVEEANDLGTLVVDDGALLLVPQQRHSDTAGVVRFDGQVDVAQEGGARDRLRCGGHLGSVLATIFRQAEAPAALAHVPVHDRHADDIFKALELPHNQRAVGPGTGIGDELRPLASRSQVPEGGGTRW